MSVAFRRDGDDEHKEPRFDVPIPPGPNLVTPRGLALIEALVADLEAADAPPGEAAAEAYRRDLRYWRQRLATARPVAPPADDEIGFGSTATIRISGRSRIVTLVGEDEADPAAGLLAISAPLARALIGAAVGDMLPFGEKADAIEVLEIGRS